MKRLTERDEYGNADIIGVDSAELQLNLEFTEFNKVTDALNRLADYEDTDLSPQDVELLKKMYDDVVKQLDEYKQADIKEAQKKFDKPCHCYGNMDWILKYPKGKEPSTSVCNCAYEKACLELTRKNAQKASEELKQAECSGTERNG